MDESISVAELADELGHTDSGRAIRVFLRNPDDGFGPFGGHRFWTPWRLVLRRPFRLRGGATAE